MSREGRTSHWHHCPEHEDSYQCSGTECIRRPVLTCEACDGEYEAGVIRASGTRKLNPLPAERSAALIRCLKLVKIGSGKFTDVAEEFEVNPRTIHRDCQALAAAGFKVWINGGRRRGSFVVEMNT